MIYDVIIVGAGSFGMSAGYSLATQGAHVLLIDAHQPPHVHGSHHGQTRIFRTAYTMGSAYVSLALRAGQLWKQLEEELDDSLSSLTMQPSPSSNQAPSLEIFRQTGVLSIGPQPSAFIASKLNSCKQFQLPYELLEKAELEQRWPVWSVPSSYSGLYEPEAGILFSENIIRAYQQLARLKGAQFVVDAPVLSIVPGHHSVTVHTSDQSYHAEKVLITAGAWLPSLLPDLNLPIRAVRKTIGWYEAPQQQYSSNVFPAFIVNHSGDEEYFGIPDVDGNGLKVGRHDLGEVMTHGQPTPSFGAVEGDVTGLDAFLHSYMPGVGSLQRGSACLYENTPDSGFMIDHHPDYDSVWFAGGGSGHGFKFASAIGEALSQQMLSGRSDSDLTAFRLGKN